MNSASTLLYPVTPKIADETIIEPSVGFKKEVTKVLFSIILFIGTYILLMAAAVLLAVLCGYGGIMLVALIPRFFTIMIGLGMIGLGLMVIYFLLKFLFKRNEVDRSRLIEITAQDQPILFDFIRKLARETQTAFPKKIYLSADVNACVFYDSGFWSMFLPIRKNLQIGLGLVNSVNVSEFKAILAHEFGHFSQKSMKLGSYVYNVNKVIHNMLFDNDGYSETLEGWAGVSGYFAFFANLTVFIVRVIQKILQHIYGLINKRYMALSREMEFHADAVAASVSGSLPLITSLRRLEVAGICYDRVLNQYKGWFRKNYKAVNIYPDHTEVMKHFAVSHDLKIENDIIEVTASSFKRFNRSRIVVKDQWASHPGTDDRELHLRKINIDAEIINSPAWALFTNVEELQKEMTSHLYADVKFKDNPEQADHGTFKTKYYDEFSRYSFDKRYKGFYDSHDIESFEIESQPLRTDDKIQFDEILNEEALALPYQISGLEADLQLLPQIANHPDIKTFDFDGIKYHRDEIDTLKKKLEKELADAKSARQDIDKKLFSFFRALAAQRGQDDNLIKCYHKLFDVTKSTAQDFAKFDSIMREVSQLYNQSVTVDAAVAITNNLKREEIYLKDRIKEILSDENYNTCYQEEDKGKLECYVEKQREYFISPNFNHEALTIFNEAMTVYSEILENKKLNIKREMLALQLSYL